MGTKKQNKFLTTASIIAIVSCCSGTVLGASVETIGNIQLSVPGAGNVQPSGGGAAQAFVSGDSLDIIGAGVPILANQPGFDIHAIRIKAIPAASSGVF